MARSPVTALVEQYNALTEVEQKVFLDLVDPQVEQEQPKIKRTRKKKDAPATQKRGLPTADGGSCTAKIPGTDDTCSQPAENLVHDPNGGYAGYHEFEAPKSKKAAAQK